MLDSGFRQSHLFQAGSWVTFAIVALALSGCMVGPNYHPPSPPVAPAFTEPALTVAASTGPSAIAYRNWWKIYQDSQLDDFESQADAANRDIKIAIAHVDEAAAATTIAPSYLLPTVGAE